MDDTTTCCPQDAQTLTREVAALEHLVGCYQQELVTNSTCLACKKKAGLSLQSAQEELFEYQQLNSHDWASVDGRRPAIVSHITRRSGEQCDFTEVALPSAEWEWTSDWLIDVHSMTDWNGWVYALSRLDLDENKMCNSDRSIEDRVRRRRWKRERKYVGSVDLPPGVTRQLQQERQLCAMQNANEKLTHQLFKANEQILDYEDRLKAYELKIRQLQSAQSDPAAASQSRAPHSVFAPIPSAIPFSPSKSRDVLHQTEALLSQIFSTAPLLEEEIRETQRRRSQMVQACHSELDCAVSEFHHLTATPLDEKSSN